MYIRMYVGSPHKYTPHCTLLSTQETCKLTNLNSYVHQADNILRKCISESLKIKASGNKYFTLKLEMVQTIVFTPDFV